MNAEPETKQSLSDEYLLTLVARQDVAAFERLYDRHSRTIYSLILHIIRKPAMAQQVLQEVFMQVWQDAGQYNESTPAADWMLRIGRNRSLIEFRHLNAEPQAQELGDDDAVNRNQAVEQPSAEAEAQYQLNRRTIISALNDLPPQQRVCVELAYFEGLTHTDIGAKSELLPGTVKKHLRIGMEKLERALHRSVEPQSAAESQSTVEPQSAAESHMRNLLPGYVFGTLEPSERPVVEQFLTESPRFWEEINMLEKTAAQLAYSAPSAHPPTGSKESILARLQPMTGRGTAGLNGGESAASRPSGLPLSRKDKTGRNRVGNASAIQRVPQSRVPQAHAGARRPAMANENRKMTLGERLSNALGWKMYALATTAALAILGMLFSQTQTELVKSEERLATTTTLMSDLEADSVEMAAQLTTLSDENAQLLIGLEGLRNTSAALSDENDQLSVDLEESQIASAALRDEVTQLTQELESLTTDRDTLQQDVDDLDEQLETNQRLFAEFSSGEPLARLRGDGPTPDATGTLWQGNSGVYLLVSGLEPLPDDQTYQLWLIPDGEDPVSSGLIVFPDDGNAPLPIELSVESDEIVTVGISIEPAEGSEFPTEDTVVLVGARL